MGTRMNLVGDIYGEYTVIEFSHVTEKNGMPHYVCMCSCGIEKTVSHGNLRSGHTTSCGCKRPRGKDNHNFVHGLSKDNKTYKTWHKIKERCFNPKDSSYESYGGSGITLQQNFKHDFLSFYKEVGDPPENSHLWSIDRIDNDKGYIEGNMRWANSFQQARNKGMMCNNTSGSNGVSWEEKIHPNKRNSTTYAIAQWKEYGSEGVQVKSKKSFSVKKFGLLPAFLKAVQHRKEVIEELNRKGYGYTENHGQ